MKALLAPLKELADFGEIKREQTKATGLIQIAGCVASQKTHFICALGEDSRYRLIVYSGDEKAKQAWEEMRFLEENVFYYPAKDLLFYHADLKGYYLKSQRMEVVRALLSLEEALGQEDKESSGMTVITTVDAFLDGLEPLSEIEKRRIFLETGVNVDFMVLQKGLADIGYVREEQVEGPGQFAVRGGIMDIFPLTGEVPVRIELWGDEIDSIRTFDVESQRSIENMQQIMIYPAEESVGNTKETVSFLDYFPQRECILYLDDPVHLAERLKEVDEEYKTRSGRTQG